MEWWPWIVYSERLLMEYIVIMPIWNCISTSVAGRILLVLNFFFIVFLFSSPPCPLLLETADRCCGEDVIRADGDGVGGPTDVVVNRGICL